MSNEACPDCGGQGVDTSWAGRTTSKCDLCEGSGRVEPVVHAMTADVGPLSADEMPNFGRKPCKADLKALEEAFRAGWAARSEMGSRVWTSSADTAWAAFLAGEMKAFEA